MEPVATADDQDSAESDIDIDAARQQIREFGERVCREEQARALQRLDHRRALSEREKQVIRTLAEDLTEELLRNPEDSLRAAASDETSEETARVALELFGKP